MTPRCALLRLRGTWIELGVRVRALTWQIFDLIGLPGSSLAGGLTRVIGDTLFHVRRPSTKEHLAPLPEAFGAVFGFWLKDPPRGEFMFARAAGQKPVSSQAARACLRGMFEKAGIEKKISPHKLRHTYATNLLNARAERVDIQALLGYSTINTTPMDTHGGPARMEQGVGRW